MVAFGQEFFCAVLPPVLWLVFMSTVQGLTYQDCCSYSLGSLIGFKSRYTAMQNSVSGIIKKKSIEIGFKLSNFSHAGQLLRAIRNDDAFYISVEPLFSALADWPVMRKHPYQIPER
jgi:hypothetical protein